MKFEFIRQVYRNQHDFILEADYGERIQRFVKKHGSFD
jgi:hypothetical protein